MKNSVIWESGKRSPNIHYTDRAKNYPIYGSKAYAALASVIDTADLAGTHPFAAISALLGSLSLPILAGGE
jgi:hypothetical protein